MYQRCGEQYRLRYMEGKIIPPGIAMVKGIGVHEGARGNFRQKIESHEDLREDDVVEMAVAGFETSLEDKGVFLTKEEESVGYRKVVDKAKDGVVSLTKLYSREVAPLYQPTLVEVKQRVLIPESVYDLEGRLDLIDDKEAIVDIKTTARAKPTNTAEKSQQLTFYALIYKALTGELPKDLCLEVLVDTLEPRRQDLHSTRGVQDLVLLTRRINRMITGILAGSFQPCSPESWMCDPRYCGYYGNGCDYV